VNTILKYAQKGNSDAQNIIGYWYSTGVLTVGDPQESAKRANQWFLSASKTNPVAAYNIANSYATGRGFPSKDMEAAVPYYEYAAKNGQINQAAVRLAFWFYQQKDYDQAQEWAKTAAGKNKKYGDFLLGKMLLNGQGISKDNQAAISTLTISVEGYNSASARLMAWAYSNGQAGQKNMQLSCAYEKIANQIGGSGNPNNANVFCNNANEADRAAGESFARNWFANHQKPAPVDYVSALSGREPQFASR
jgi:TPR repeat protein